MAVIRITFQNNVPVAAEEPRAGGGDPAGVGRGDLRAGFAAVPVPDAAPVSTVTAWPPHSTSRALAGLVRAATRL